MNKRIKIGSNRYQVIGDDNTIVFYSYETPVAVRLAKGGALITNRRYSVTTSKHMSQFPLGSGRVERVDQDVIDRYADRAEATRWAL